MRLLTLLLLFPLFGAPSRGSAQEPKSSEGHITTPDRVRLFYRVYGDRGDTIIYLHGGPGGTLERQLPNLLPLAQRHVISRTTSAAEGGLTLETRHASPLRGMFRILKTCAGTSEWSGRRSWGTRGELRWRSCMRTRIHKTSPG